jgi:hypothetical protein
MLACMTLVMKPRVPCLDLVEAMYLCVGYFMLSPECLGGSTYIAGQVVRRESVRICGSDRMFHLPPESHDSESLVRTYRSTCSHSQRNSGNYSAPTFVSTSTNEGRRGVQEE